MCGPYGWWALEHGHSRSIALLWQGWRVCKGRRAESKRFFLQKRSKKLLLPVGCWMDGWDLVTQLFGREALLDALDRIGRVAVAHGTMLDIAIYGGSALMLASNFRFATEDVDMAALDAPWPAWLSGVVRDLAHENGWSPDPCCAPGGLAASMLPWHSSAGFLRSAQNPERERFFLKHIWPEDNDDTPTYPP